MVNDWLLTKPRTAQLYHEVMKEFHADAQELGYSILYGTPASEGVHDWIALMVCPGPSPAGSPMLSHDKAQMLIFFFNLWQLARTPTALLQQMASEARFFPQSWKASGIHKRMQADSPSAAAHQSSRPMPVYIPAVLL
jgi:hypothetical protein